MQICGSCGANGCSAMASVGRWWLAAISNRPPELEGRIRLVQSSSVAVPSERLLMIISKYFTIQSHLCFSSVTFVIRLMLIVELERLISTVSCMYSLYSRHPPACRNIYSCRTRSLKRTTLNEFKIHLVDRLATRP